MDRHPACRYLCDEACGCATDPGRARVRRLGVREADALRQRAHSERARVGAGRPAGARPLREPLALDRERGLKSRRCAVSERPCRFVHPRHAWDVQGARPLPQSARGAGARVPGRVRLEPLHRQRRSGGDGLFRTRQRHGRSAGHARARVDAHARLVRRSARAVLRDPGGRLHGGAARRLASGRRRGRELPAVAAAVHADRLPVERVRVRPIARPAPGPRRSRRSLFRARLRPACSARSSRDSQAAGRSGAAPGSTAPSRACASST